jgi:predicted ATPase
LQQLLEAQLVVLGGMSHQPLLFRHALIQDTAYQSLLTRKRRQYHQTIADTIVRSQPNMVATQLVAGHYTEGRCDELALQYWKKAGERALERFANDEASDHFSNALAIAERLPDGPQRSLEMLAARLRLAEALHEAGRFKAAATQYRVAADHARQADDADSFVRVAIGYDWAQFLLGMPLEQSAALLTEAEAKIAPDDDRQRCQVLSSSRGRTCFSATRRGAKASKDGELNLRAGWVIADLYSHFSAIGSWFRGRLRRRLKYKADCRN